MKARELIEAFEARVGFTIPPDLAVVMVGETTHYIANPKLFREAIPIFPIHNDFEPVSPDDLRLGYDFRYGEVDMGEFRHEACLINDIFGNGDLLFFIGKDGKFLPTLYFANHETGEVQEVVQDIGSALMKAAS